MTDLKVKDERVFWEFFTCCRIVVVRNNSDVEKVGMVYLIEKNSYLFLPLILKYKPERKFTRFVPLIHTLLVIHDPAL